MIAFDAAWSVIKQEYPLIQQDFKLPMYRGEGARAAVFQPEGQENVYKIPKSQDTVRGANPPPSDGSFVVDNPPFLHEIATMNALSQLGYPIVPERPAMARTIPADWMADVPREPRTIRALTQRAADSMGGDAVEDYLTRRKLTRSKHPGISALSEQYGGWGADQDDALMRYVRAEDIRPANIGVFGGEAKILDMQSGLPVSTWDNQPIANHTNLERMMTLPDEQRRSFVELFGDKSQFDPWRTQQAYQSVNDLSNRAFDKAYAEYLNRVNNMKNMSSFIDDPYQTRLEEFGEGDEADFNRLRINQARQAVLNRRRKNESL